VSAYDVSVLGAGRFGSALAGRMRRAGLRVAVGSRRHDTPQVRAVHGGDAMPYEDACRASELVVLAVPWRAAVGTAARLRPVLAGRVLVDATNPVTADWSRLDVGEGGLSGAERIAAAAGGVAVIKAFNGLKAELVDDPAHGPPVRQVWCCGDPDEARARVMTLAARCGFLPVDCGTLENALCLEAAALLWIRLAYWEGRGEGLRLVLDSGAG